MREFVAHVETRTADLSVTVPGAPRFAELAEEDHRMIDEEKQRARATYADLGNRMDRLADTLSYLADRCRTRQVVEAARVGVEGAPGTADLMDDVGDALRALEGLAEIGDQQLADSAMDNLAEDISQLEQAGLEAQAEADAALEVGRLLDQFPVDGGHGTAPGVPAVWFAAGEQVEWMGSEHDQADADHSSGLELGTFIGVYTPTVLTILGVILYMRMGWVVGNAGIWGTVGIVLLANAITAITALSLSALATNMRVGVGGAFISPSLGLELGGALGIPLYLSQALSVTLYAYGLAESLVWLRRRPRRTAAGAPFTRMPGRSRPSAPG